MTVGELKEKLAKYPDNAGVLTYIEGEETYSSPSSVYSVDNQDDMPYAKGNKPEVGEATVLIDGCMV